MTLLIIPARIVANILLERTKVSYVTFVSYDSAHDVNSTYYDT